MHNKIGLTLLFAGILLFFLNFWAADYDWSKLNYLSTGASIVILIIGAVKLLRKRNYEN